ncbi:hypothetical protein GCM10007423_29090 [Dyadobacter endophyticus]|uniref:Uncharacterized protein n=1 Tax=Dyadobacter endophyticus TaxID=1749036 RepID=A0ABQ1YU59_9BACT|nr:hypothetical protein GCM10007423_29090 [Dyadobacter endophyticus]
MTLAQGYGLRIELFMPDRADSADFDNETEYDIEAMVLGYSKLTTKSNNKI